MSTKSATVLARIEPRVKNQAEAVLNNLGISPSTAINVFYRQVIRSGGIPFELSIKRPDIPNLDEMNHSEIASMLAQSDKEIKSDKITPADSVFKELHREFGI